MIELVPVLEEGKHQKSTYGLPIKLIIFTMEGHRNFKLLPKKFYYVDAPCLVTRLKSPRRVISLTNLATLYFSAFSHV